MKKEKQKLQKLPQALVLMPPHAAGCDLADKEKEKYQLDLAESLADGIRRQGGRATVDRPLAKVITDATVEQIAWALQYRGRSWLWRVYRGEARDRRLLAKEGGG